MTTRMNDATKCALAAHIADTTGCHPVIALDLVEAVLAACDGTLPVRPGRLRLVPDGGAA